MVDARKVGGKITEIEVLATADGNMTLKLPEGKYKKTLTGKAGGLKEENGFLKVFMEKGSSLKLSAE